MIYQFNKITLDTAQYRLCLADKPISVEPQVFDLLAYLIAHRDRVVTRDELLENLWKGKVVTDSALGARLKAARKAVGDSGNKQEIIKTIHGRGYQFVSQVTEKDAEAKKTEQTNLDINKTNQPRTNTPSIAVLPFQNMSAEPEQEYFADGMSEEIITALSRIPGLVVISRNSTFVYKGRKVDVRQVGRELDVGYVLEGSVRKMDDRLRITAQLVSTQSGNHVWADRYDRKLDDIFAVQDEITHNIVVELQIKLVTGELSRLLAKGTKNIEAWELTIRSSSLAESHVQDDAMVAKKLLNRALELDSNYAAAWALLGWVYWEESVWEWSAEPEIAMQMAFEAAQKSVTVDPHFPNGYSLLGHIYLSRGDSKKAIVMNEKAVELAPSDSDAMALLANVLIDLGRIKEGIQKIQRAIRLCPFPPSWYLTVLGVGFHLDGDNESAVSILEQAVEREPNSHFPRVWLACTLVEMGRLDDARETCKAALTIEPNFSTTGWAESYMSDSHAGVKDNLLAAGFPE